MEYIIDLIFSNLFFVILIAGALFNLFIRGAKEQEKKNEHQPRKTTPKPFQEVDWKEIFNQERAPSPFEPIDPKPIEKQPINEVEIAPPTQVDELQKQREEIERKEREAEMLLNRAGNSPIFQEKEELQAPATKLKFNKLTNDEIIKGIIWSEVLDKPRAKRPMTFRR